MPSLLKHKLRALLIHLGISAAVLLSFLYLIWFHWYPEPLFFTEGAGQGLRIMWLVDLVLGPSLTFLVFNPSKTRRALLVDFTCIGLIQAAALVYGIYNVHSVRPWAVSYYDGAFYAVSRQAFEDQVVPDGAWDALGDGAPYHVYAREPANEQEAAGVAAFSLLAGVGPEGLLFLYEPLERHLEAVRGAALDIDKLAAADTALRNDLERLRQRHAGQSLRFLPLHGFQASVIVAVDAEARIVGVLYHSPPAADAGAPQ